MSFGVALVVCAAVTPFLALVASRIGLVDRPSGDALKIHAEPRPLSGGIGVAIAISVSVAFTARGSVGPGWIVAIALLLALGVTDDAVGLPPLARLVVQILTGALLVAGGLAVEPLGAVGSIAVVLVVPALANAVNITDGQDGLAAGLGAIAALGIWAVGDGAGTPGLVALATAGALLGFLVWNKPRASVFLGDGGAYAIGGLLAVLAIEASTSWPRLLGCLLCLGVFALELVSTVIRRFRGRASLVTGDRDHVYDLLASRLGNRTWSTLVMCGTGLVLAVAGWAASMAPTPVAAAVVFLVALVGALGAMVVARRDREPLRRTR